MAKSEQSALLPPQNAPADDRFAGRLQQVAYGCFLGVLMIVLSATLIDMNKYLMSPGIFPHAVALILIQSLFCTLFSGVLLLLCPSLFPSLTDPTQRIVLDSEYIVKRTSPVTILFVGQLILGNIAFKYASVAFLQMLKQSNVALVYALSVLMSIEVFKGRNAIVLALIMVATAATVEGELHFSMLGLIIQGTCNVFESMRAVVQSTLLSGTGRKLDGLSYVLVVMPQVLLVLGLLVLVDVAVYDISFVTLPSWTAVVQFRWTLAGNAFLAFALNVVTALFIKHSSALAFLLANIAKNALIVLTSAAVFGEALSDMQGVAFSVQLVLILLWSMMKSFPELFADGGSLAFLFPSSLREKAKAIEA